MSISRNFVVAAWAATALGLSATAHADPADYLKSQLRATPEAGKFIREFPAPDTLTGVVIELPGGQKMVGYVTPSGRYLISGVVIDLQSNTNLTQTYAAKYGGKPPPQPSVHTAEAVYEIGKMATIGLGNPQASNFIAVLFDPTTPLGKDLMFSMMNSVSHYVKTPIMNTAKFEFIPYGPMAAQLLKGSNEQRLKNLLAYAQGKKLPEADASSTQWANTNTRIATHMKAKPPIMVLNMPGEKKAQVVSFEGANTPVAPQLMQMIGMISGETP